MAGANQACIFCQIVRNPTSTRLLHTDDKVIAFQDIKPAAQRHYQVIPKEHIPTVKDLQRSDEDYSLVRHMLSVGQELLQKDAPQAIHRWKAIKYKSLGPLGGFIEPETLLEKIRPLLSKGRYWLQCMGYWCRCVLATT